jgi:hypothetical protein
MTIADEVSVSAMGEASMLIRQVVEHENDLSGFHKLEERVQGPWMPQALACIAARLLTDLVEVKSMEPGELLTQIMNSGRRFGP